MYEIKDGARTFRFSGVRLSTSSSWRPGSTRWIEFELYRTDNDSYILSRVGVSLVYHTSSCPKVRKYRLQEETVDDLSLNAIECEDCNPTRDIPLVFPEKMRYWAQVSDEAEAVLEALYQRDETGARYLTRVADRLLKSASELDNDISRVYHVEVVP